MVDIIRAIVLLSTLGLFVSFILFLIYNLLKIITKYIIDKKGKGMSSFELYFSKDKERYLQLLFFATSTFFFIVFIIGFIMAIIYPMFPPHQAITLF